MKDKKVIIEVEKEKTDLNDKKEDNINPNKTSVLDWIKKHENEIKTAAIPIGGAALIAFGYLIGNNSKENVNLKISKLKLDNLLLTSRINDLEQLCFEKDSVMNKVMSDGFRHGSPESARQMAYKRHAVLH